MTEFHQNVYDLNGYKAKKAELEMSKFKAEDSSSTISAKQLDSQISNIKKSISRINQLMEELRSFSKKNHPNS